MVLLFEKQNHPFYFLLNDRYLCAWRNNPYSKSDGLRWA